MDILNNFSNAIWETIQTIVLSLALFLVLYIFVILPYFVEGNSMYPNYKNGDFLIISKLDYRFGQPQVGDVVVLHAPDENKDYIKRIIGLPGDTIEIKDGYIFRNGIQLVEDVYLDNTVVTEEGDFAKSGESVTIPLEHYFVMGDNRSDSFDSRYFGPVESSLVKGKVLFRLWPPQSVGIPNREAVYSI